MTAFKKLHSDEIESAMTYYQKAFIADKEKLNTYYFTATSRPTASMHISSSFAESFIIECFKKDPHTPMKSENGKMIRARAIKAWFEHLHDGVYTVTSISLGMGIDTTMMKYFYNQNLTLNPDECLDLIL